MKHRVTFDKTMSDGTEVMVYATASSVTPYTAKDLRIELHTVDGSDIKNINPDEMDEIEEEAIEKFNEVSEVDF